MILALVIAMSSFAGFSWGKGEFNHKDTKTQSFFQQDLLLCLRVFVVKKLLTSDDCFDLVALEKCDEAVASIPDAVACAPNFVSLNLATTRQHDHRFAALSLSDAWSTG